MVIDSDDNRDLLDKSNVDLVQLGDTGIMTPREIEYEMVEE